MDADNADITETPARKGEHCDTLRLISVTVSSIPMADGEEIPTPSPTDTPACLTSASPPRSPSPTQDREARLVAIERRQAAARSAAAAEFRPFDADHEQRQRFRRLIDPGIMRPNPVDVARASLRVMSRICPPPLAPHCSSSRHSP